MTGLDCAIAAVGTVPAQAIPTRHRTARAPRSGPTRAGQCAAAIERPNAEPRKKEIIDTVQSTPLLGIVTMPSATINEIIQMYSNGVISRESLEREIVSVEIASEKSRENCENGDFLVLYPDQSGTWRLPA